MADIIRAQINTLPTGLLSLYGLKTFGKGPASLSENLLATYDAREHYFSTFTVGRGTTSAAAGIVTGTIGFIACDQTSVGVVPSGKAWLLLNLMVRVAGLAAGDTVLYSPSLGHPNSAGVPGEPEALAQPQLFTGLATATLPAVPMDQGHRGRILMPGTAIGLNVVQAVQAAGRTATAFFRFIELDA